MPQGKTTKFMESVIFGLYNYASSRREAYLLLQLFKTALREEVRQVPQKRGGGGGGPGRRRWSSPPPRRHVAVRPGWRVAMEPGAVFSLPPTETVPDT